MEQVQKSQIKNINIVFLVTILISVTVPFLPLDFIAEQPVLQIAFSQALMVLPSIVYMLGRRLSYAETVRLKRMKAADMALSILFGILIQPVITLINALSMVFSQNTLSLTMMDLAEQLPFWSTLILVAVVPAILEESVYRGVFYNEYSKVNPWKAALLSGLLFGIMHGNINQFCYATAMGIIFALLIEATGSILSTMLVHFWTNAGSVVMLYLYPKLYELAQSFYNMYQEYENESMAALIEASFGDMTKTPSEWVRQMMNSAAALKLTVPQVLMLYGPQALIMGALAFLVYRKLAMRNGTWCRICSCFKRQKNVQEETPEGQQRLITIPLLVAIIIGIAFMIFYEAVLRINLQ